ncbi:hypothetical protein F7725_003085, partial [Dissostichus mawsoni]
MWSENIYMWSENIYMWSENMPTSHIRIFLLDFWESEFPMTWNSMIPRLSSSLAVSSRAAFGCSAVATGGLAGGLWGIREAELLTCDGLCSSGVCTAQRGDAAQTFGQSGGAGDCSRTDHCNGDTPRNSMDRNLRTFRELPPGHSEDGLEQAAAEHVRGLIARQAVVTLGDVAVAQPPG